MGQSMARPQGSRLSSQRGTRSLRHSARNTTSNPSLLDQRRSSLSPRRSLDGAICPPTTPQATPLTQEYSQLPPSPAIPPASSLEGSFHLKVDCGHSQDTSHLRERSLVSPNFGEAAPGQDEYCFQEEWSGRGRESVARQQTQHDMTISFSKSKNYSTNPFQGSEMEESRGQVGNVLESGGESSEGHRHRAVYYVGQQKAASRKESKMTPKSQSKRSQGSKQGISHLQTNKNSQLWSSSEEYQVPANPNNSYNYNDYDTSLPTAHKKCQLSSKMLEIKSKLQNRLHDSKIMTSFSRQSVNNMSHSRSFRSQLRSGSRSLRKTHVPESDNSFRMCGKESVMTFKQTKHPSKVVRPSQDYDYDHKITKKHHECKKTESSVSQVPLKAQKKHFGHNHKQRPTKAPQPLKDKKHRPLPHKPHHSKPTAKGSKLIIF